MNSLQPPILEARGLTKHFVSGSVFSRRIVRALEDFNVKLYPGRVTALVGESGSGKSTASRLLSRLYETSSTQEKVFWRRKAAATCCSIAVGCR